MPVNIDRFSRMVNNLYTRVFEQGQQPEQNAIFKYARAFATPLARPDYFTGWVREVQRDLPMLFMRMQDDNYSFYTNAAYGSMPMSNLGSGMSATAAIATWSQITKPVGNYIDGTTKDSGVWRVDWTIGGQETIDTSAVLLGSISMEFIVNNVVNPTGADLSLWSINAGSCEVLITNTGVLKAKGPGAVVVTGGSGLLTGRHHIVVTWEQGLVANGILLYVDGVNVGNGACGAIANTWAGIFFNTAINTKSIELDELVVYGTALAPNRVTAHYNTLVNRTAVDPIPAVESYVTPTPRYYSALTQSAGADRSNDRTAWGFTTTDKITYSNAVCNSTQMWGVFRLIPTWASGTPPASPPDVWRWFVDASNNLALKYTGGNWQFSRLNAGAGASATVAGAHAVNEPLTLAFNCTSTVVQIGLNGTYQATVGNTAIPTLTSVATMDIGNGTNPLTGAIAWMMLGVGTLSQADFTTLHNLGNTDPEWFDVPNMVTLDPSFLWHARSLEHVPTGGFGESVYA